MKKLTGAAAALVGVLTPLAFLLGCSSSDEGGGPKTSPLPINIHSITLGIALSDPVGPSELLQACQELEAGLPEAGETCDGGGVLGMWQVEAVRTLPFPDLDDPPGVSSRTLLQDALTDEGWTKGGQVSPTCRCAEEEDTGESVCAVLWRCKKTV